MNILFIAPLFYGYETAIITELKIRYKNVYFYNEIPFTSAVFFAINRFSSRLSQKILFYYSIFLFNVVKRKSIDKVFIVRGFGLKSVFFDKIFSNCPRVEIINYQWDSILNNKNGLMISNYAHRNYSFDLLDVYKYPQFKHVPLFYSWDGLKEKSDVKKDIDLLFLGIFHSNRNKIVNSIYDSLHSSDIVFKSVIYHPVGSFIRKMFTSDRVKASDVSFLKISKSNYYDLLNRSKVVLDIHHASQAGATIRSIEALSIGCKLLTTNQMIQNELFFSGVNIKIWNQSECFDIHDLLNTQFDHSKDCFIYNVSDWLNKLEI